MRVSRFTAEGEGVVEYVDANEIHVRYERNEIQKLVSFEEDLKIYKLTKFIKTNQETCINLKPAVKKGQKCERRRFPDRRLCSTSMVNWRWAAT